MSGTSGVGVERRSGCGSGWGCGCGGSILAGVGGAAGVGDAIVVVVSGIALGVVRSVVCSAVRSVGSPSFPQVLIRMISTMRPNRTKMMLRTVCLSGRSGDVPGGTARSGRCGAPQLGQKLAVGRISVPQFSQKRLPSDKQRSLLPGGLLTAPNTRHTCRLGQLDVRYGPIPDDCGPAQAGASVVRGQPRSGTACCPSPGATLTRRSRRSRPGGTLARRTGW